MIYKKQTGYYTVIHDTVSKSELSLQQKGIMLELLNNSPKYVYYKNVIDDRYNNDDIRELMGKGYLSIETINTRKGEAKVYEVYEDPAELFRKIENNLNK